MDRSPRPCRLSLCMAQPTASHGFASGTVSDGPCICTRGFQACPVALEAKRFKTPSPHEFLFPARGQESAPQQVSLSGCRCLDRHRSSVWSSADLVWAPRNLRAHFSRGDCALQLPLCHPECVRKGQCRRTRRLCKLCRGDTYCVRVRCCAQPGGQRLHTWTEGAAPDGAGSVLGHPAVGQESRS